MPRYRVEALERFIVRTVYHVDAESPERADALCKSGDVAYDGASIEEGDDQWPETVSVEESD